MGKFKEEIILTNAKDEMLMGAGACKEVRQVTVKAIVDTGAMTLYIDEATCAQLGLDITGTRMARVADGRSISSKVTSPVGIRWKNRYTSIPARVLPGAENTLLGAIPLEDMDLMVDMPHQCLVGAHGDEPLEEID